MSRTTWIPWTQPVLSSNTDYGVVSASSMNAAAAPWKALDGIISGSTTSWESGKGVIPSSWQWVLPHRLRITEITLYNKYSGSTNVTCDAQVYADSAMTIPIGPQQTFAASAFSTVTVTPDSPVETDTVVVYCSSSYGTAGNNYVGLGEVVITAQQEQVEYEVVFLDWDGAELNGQWVASGGSADAPMPPTRSGYTFIGWDVPLSNITADTVVTAQYELCSYTVVFLDWDGAVIKTEAVLYMQDATPPDDPVREGYVFTGWDGSYRSITADTTVTAQYISDGEKLVRFLDYDSTVLSSQYVPTGQDALPPLPPNRENYIFDHWNGDYTAVTAARDITAVYRAALTHTAISVYRGNTLVQTLDRVLSATLKESLEGELTLEFSTLADRCGGVDIGCVAHFEDSYFNIVRVSKSISSGLMVTTAVCEHISYILNNDEYKLTEFSFTGSPADCLAALLTGTQLTVGQSDFTEAVTLQINKQCTRRAALMQLVALVNGELEYSGDSISLRSHRGSSERSELLDTRNVTDVSVTGDSRSSTTSYEIAFHKKAECSVGDEVHILFSPLGINVNTRIISMEYNPFYKYSVRVEVGSYVPVFNASLYEKETDTELEEIEKEVETLTTDISTINTDLGDLTTDFGDLTTDFETINTDVTNLTTDLGDLSTEVNTLSTNCQSKCRRFIVIAESDYDPSRSYGEVGDVIAVVED